MGTKFIFKVLWLIPFGISANSFTQTVNDTVKIKEAVINAAVFEDSLPVNVSRLKKSQLLWNDEISLAPAVNTIPGVYMQQGALNTSRIVVRGMGSRTQYSSNRIKAYINEIPVSSADGETVIEDLDPTLFESFDVYKSPQVIYGSKLGGTFVLNTNQSFKNSLTHRQTVGSFGLLSNSTALSLNKNKSSLMVAYNRVTKDGYRENSEYNRDGITLFGKQGLGKKNVLNYYLQYTDLKAYISSSIDETTFRNSPQSAAYSWNQAQGYEFYRKLISGLSLETFWTKNLKTSSTLYTQLKNGYEPRPFNILDEDYKRFGARFLLEWKHRLFTKTAGLKSGFEIQSEENDIVIFQNRYDDVLQNGIGSIEGREIDRNILNFYSGSYFIYEKINWSKKLHSVLGLNVNTTSYSSKTNRFTSDNNTINPQLSIQFRTDYSFTDHLTLYALWSQGFSNPGIENAIDSDGNFNNDIESEKGNTFEFGGKAELPENGLVFLFSAYRLHLEDMIVSQPVGNNEFRIVNAGEVNNRGLELQVVADFPLSDSWKKSTTLSSGVNFYKFGTFSENGFSYSGNELTGNPTHTINILEEIAFKNKLFFTVNYLNVGKIPLNDENTRYSEAYGLFHAAASYRFLLSKAFSLSAKAGINNIFNKRYAASVLPNASGFGNNLPRYYYPGDARNYFGSLQLNYNFSK